MSLLDKRIVAVGAGDEFSVAVDSRIQPWGWGRAEQGQVKVYIRQEVYSVGYSTCCACEYGSYTKCND